MFKLFMEGGPVFMAILTAVLAAMFFAAWKAPRWVKEIGAFALIFGIFSTFLLIPGDSRPPIPVILGHPC